jgi:hypothetical protein
MRGVAGIFVQTEAADPDQFEAIGRLITDVNRCWRVRRAFWSFQIRHRYV